MDDKLSINKEALFSGGEYIDLRKKQPEIPKGIDLEKMERLTKAVRALIFATVEAGQSGHPGGSSSKVEQLLSLILGGAMAFDPLDPKNPSRDRVVWSAGHCTPLHYAVQTLFYESLKRIGKDFDPEKLGAVMADDLVRFRHSDGPQGHVEGHHPLADISTGASGHGLSAALGLAISHRGSGLPTKVWTIMGDAETEEGITFEARNMALASGIDNLIALVDFNRYGIDGPIKEVISDNYLNHWLGLGWNVIEIDGHDLSECLNAYQLVSQGHFDNKRPTAILAHSVKGKLYGSVEDTEKSHGSPINHEEYVEIIKSLGFDIDGKSGETEKDISAIISQISDEDMEYVTKRLAEAAQKVPSEDESKEAIKKALGDRKLVDARSIQRPATLPTELVFEAGDNVATRKAAGAWFRWMMDQTAFFYTGAGDLGGSIQTAEAEKVYGVVSPDNPYGRGLRFGIAEQNLAMSGTSITQDILPGGYRPVSAVGSYGVFSTIMGNCIRMSVINNHLNPKMAGFYVLVMSHDGPETGEDGPTHQGMYWMSLYKALPGIKVYKPFDANETIEMLFHALEKGEPIVLSLMRPETPVLKRTNGISPAREAINGAYIYKDFTDNEKPKKVLVISGARLLMNTLEILPKLEEINDIKIVNVTSPELFHELRLSDPEKAKKIFSDKDRINAITLHNGWTGFLNEFLAATDYDKRSIGIETYLKSGNPEEVYELAELGPNDILEKINNIS